jgi:hypothetical protein
MLSTTLCKGMVKLCAQCFIQNKHKKYFFRVFFNFVSVVPPMLGLMIHTMIIYNWCLLYYTWRRVIALFVWLCDWCKSAQSSASGTVIPHSIQSACKAICVIGPAQPER